MQAIIGVLIDSPGAVYAISTIISYGYYIALEGGPRGQTVGKMALGIRVIDFNGGGPIGYPRALVRQLVKIVSGHPARPRLLLDAVGQGEAVLARQGGQRRRRPGRRVPRSRLNIKFPL